MLRRVQLMVTWGFLAVALLLSIDCAVQAAPPPPKPKPTTTKKPPKKPAKPHAKPHPPSKKTYKVQARNTHWRRAATMSNSNRAAAVALAHRLRHRGFSVAVHHPGGRAWVVDYRNLHWHTRMVTHNAAAARRAANMLHSQGLQARII